VHFKVLESNHQWLAAIPNNSEKILQEVEDIDQPRQNSSHLFHQEKDKRASQCPVKCAGSRNRMEPSSEIPWHHPGQKTSAKSTHQLHN
jgi:hypothetical protein